MAANNRLIPPALEGEVVSQHLAGKSTREIARWLLAEHKLEISYRSVARFLEGTRRERAEGIKASVRETLGPQVLDDLARLEVHAQKLHELALELFEKGKAKEYRFTVEQLRKVAHSRLHFSGADAPDDSLSDLAEATDRVARRLARLAPRGAAEGSAGDAGDNAGGDGSA